MSEYINMSDESIVDIAQGGSEAAAEFLLRKYKNMVNAAARRFYIVGAEQEDIIQEGMIGLYKAILKYKADKTKFSTFAYQCITRSMIDALKTSLSGKNQPLKNYKSISDLDEGYFVENNTPENIMVREEQIESMWKQVEEILSTVEYKVFKLYIEGLNIREIAESANITYKACDNALQRIKNKIKATQKS